MGKGGVARSRSEIMKNEVNKILKENPKLTKKEAMQVFKGNLAKENKRMYSQYYI